MSNELVEYKSIPEKNGSCFAVSNYTEAQRVAMSLAASSIVPEIFRQKDKNDHGAIANCLIALDMAVRLNMSPLLVMQNMYIVHGRPSWSASFFVAAINKSGLFKTSLRYKMSGSDDDFGCVAWAIDNSDEVLESSRITIKMAKDEGWYTKNGSKWKTMAEQMLKYRAATFFCRAYCPEVAMGMQTDHEVVDTYDPSESISNKRMPMSEKIQNIIKENCDAVAINNEENISLFESLKKKIENVKTFFDLDAVSKEIDAAKKESTLSKEEMTSIRNLFAEKNKEKCQ